MHGPNEFNIFHVINLHTTSINLCLTTCHQKIIMQTFHSQLHFTIWSYITHIHFTIYTHSFHKLTQQQSNFIHFRCIITSLLNYVQKFEKMSKIMQENQMWNLQLVTQQENDKYANMTHLIVMNQIT